jgi:hypothetical protein
VLCTASADQISLPLQFCDEHLEVLRPALGIKSGVFLPVPHVLAALSSQHKE